jgi:hypothetical protein
MKKPERTEKRSCHFNSMIFMNLSPGEKNRYLFFYDVEDASLPAGTNGRGVVESERTIDPKRGWDTDAHV